MTYLEYQESNHQLGPSPGKFNLLTKLMVLAEKNENKGTSTDVRTQRGMKLTKGTYLQTFDVFITSYSLNTVQKFLVNSCPHLGI